MLKLSHCLLPLAMICGLSVHAADLYVAPYGIDRNPSTQSAPCKTLSAARKLVGKEAVKVTVADGTYYFPETLVYTPTDSGSEKYPIIYQAKNEGKAIISGGLKLDFK